jgi:hypothetical protein
LVEILTPLAVLFDENKLKNVIYKILVDAKNLITGGF